MVWLPEVMSMILDHPSPALPPGQPVVIAFVLFLMLTRVLIFVFVIVLVLVLVLVVIMLVAILVVFEIMLVRLPARPRRGLQQQSRAKICSSQRGTEPSAVPFRALSRAAAVLAPSHVLPLS